MIISINDSVLNIAQANEPLFLEFLLHMASQLKKKKHFLYLTKKFNDFLKKHEAVDSAIKDFFDGHYKSHNDTCALMKFSKILFEISDCPNYEMLDDEEKKIIRIPLSEVVDRIDFLQCILISENLSDSEFYSQLGERFISRKKLKNCKISCKCRGGGGNEISSESCKIISEGDTPLLCIFDSDRLSPVTPYRNKCYDKVLKCINESHFFIAFALLLNSRCIDAIYPYNLVKLSSEEYRSIFALKRIQEALISSDDPDALLTYKFIKLSKKMTLKHIKILCNEMPDHAENIKQFWDKFLSSVSYDDRVCQKGLSAPLENPCPADDHKCSYCVVKQAPDLAKQMKELLEKNLNVDLSDEPFSHTVEDWEAIEDYVFSFFCTSKRHEAGKPI